MLEEWYYIDDTPKQPNGHFRHQRWANVAFCDGHVEGAQPEPGSLDPRLPSAGVGRFAPAILQVP